MVSDSHLKRARIIQAGRREFVERGLAGARPAHICREAGVNSQAIQGYFGTREGLFDVVIYQENRALAGLLTASLPDVAAGAGDLFEHLMTRSDAVRLQRWRVLERPSTPPIEHQVLDGDSRAVAGALAVSEDRARELLAMLVDLVLAWVVDASDVQRTPAISTGQRRRCIETTAHVLIAACRDQHEPPRPSCTDRHASTDLAD